jgi:molecular chaperone DnaK
MAELNTAWTAASEDIYKAQADGGAAAQEPTNQGASQGETVTDAEFEEVK